MINKKKVSKQDIIDWDDFIENMNRAAPIDSSETPSEKAKRIAHLEAHPLEWFKYYLAAFCYSEFAKFQKAFVKRATTEMEWYEVLAWSRELAKSTIVMMVVLFLVLTGKKKNIILTSNSFDNAVRLLAPYKSLLAKNARIIHDYGIQEKIGSWKDDEFITRSGAAFRAVGAGQSPRGSRNESVRPDVLLIDDFDTDEDCRNPDTIDKKWDWLERAFYATRSVSNPLQVIFCGNIIAEYCCITKAIEIADHHEIINIRDKQGKSTWPEKNTEEMIDRTLSKISYASQQGEYFNNPLTQGKVFKYINYGKMRPLQDYKFIVTYTDPSYKARQTSDFKATAAVGKYRDEYHVLWMYCRQTTTAEMLDWQYDIMKKVDGKVPVYFMIEWPAIDDPIKLELNRANTRHRITLPLRADERDKPDKFYRIESLLEPLNRNGQLIFNEKIKNTEDMRNTEAQFKALSAKSRAHDDAPDAVEGAVFDINRRVAFDVSLIDHTPRAVFNKKSW